MIILFSILMSGKVVILFDRVIENIDRIFINLLDFLKQKEFINGVIKYINF